VKVRQTQSHSVKPSQTQSNQCDFRFDRHCDLSLCAGRSLGDRQEDFLLVEFLCQI